MRDHGLGIPREQRRDLHRHPAIDTTRLLEDGLKEIGGTAQILRTVVASRILGRKLPQTRDGYMEEGRSATTPAKQTNF